MAHAVAESREEALASRIRRKLENLEKNFCVQEDMFLKTQMMRDLLEVILSYEAPPTDNEKTIRSIRFASLHFLTALFSDTCTVRITRKVNHRRGCNKGHAKSEAWSSEWTVSSLPVYRALTKDPETTAFALRRIHRLTGLLVPEGLVCEMSGSRALIRNDSSLMLVTQCIAKEWFLLEVGGDDGVLRGEKLLAAVMILKLYTYTTLRPQEVHERLMREVVSVAMNIAYDEMYMSMKTGQTMTYSDFVVDLMCLVKAVDVSSPRTEYSPRQLVTVFRLMLFDEHRDAGSSRWWFETAKLAATWSLRTGRSVDDLVPGVVERFPYTEKVKARLLRAFEANELMRHLSLFVTQCGVCDRASIPAVTSVNDLAISHIRNGLCSQKCAEVLM